jgi:hypothetical protein
LKAAAKQTIEVQPEIVVIDDDRLFRQSIRRLLETHGGLHPENSAEMR